MIPLSDPLLDLPLSGLRAAIDEGQIRPSELTEAFIGRIQAVNPKINALVQDRFAAAREEAAAADRVAGQADRGPLMGIPCTMKEFLGTKGMSHTAGILPRQADRASADGSAVARIRGAGGIILGVSNVPEGGLWMETCNKIYGRTRNPWDLRRSPGGSSGGEGALVGAGASPFGLGSDVGGSIRIPAAFCGTFGHKPTGGLVPNTGHNPPAPGKLGPYLCIGPLARSTGDLRLLLSLIAGPDGQDPACTRHFDQTTGAAATWRSGRAPGDLRGLRVLPLEENGFNGVRPVMREALRTATRILKDQGATIIEPNLPRFKKGFLIWSAMLDQGAVHRYDHLLGGGQPISPLIELFKAIFGRSQHSVEGLLLTIFDVWGSKLPMDLSKMAAEGPLLQAELEEALGENGVLLHPPYSRPAPLHHDSWRTVFDVGHTAIFNVLESPVTVVPMARPEGLPVGLQVVGARGRDDLTLDVAAALEAAGCNFQRAPSPFGG